jgi:hypothetical protein
MVEADKARLPAHSPCLADGCTRLNYSNGLCRSHYYKKRRADATALRPLPEPRLCEVEGCYGSHYGRGLCQQHYFQDRRHPEMTLTGEQMTQRYPSLRWGVREWQAALTVRGDVMDHILDDMHRLAFP